MQNVGQADQGLFRLYFCIFHFAFCILTSGCAWLDRLKARTDGATATATGEVRPARADELVARLNQQAAVVKVVRYPDVAIDLDGPDVPVKSLGNSQLVAAQPRMLLLKGGKVGFSGLVEVGSNDREFWLSLDAPATEKLYLYCAHQDFPQAAGKLPVPFDPEWALLALGLTGVDPDAARYTADTDPRKRTYTLKREATTPGGRRVDQYVVFAADEPAGTRPLVQQHFITEPGNLRRVIAQADIASVYRVPNSGGAEVPTDVTLRWPEQKFSMRLRMRNPVVNEALDPEQVRRMFTRPDARGVTPINLADASFRPTSARGQAPDQPRRGIFNWRR
jgi:hypothetical protein